ncbi:DUF6907 domain-containing protein [Streptomyces sp. NPDC000878]
MSTEPRTVTVPTLDHGEITIPEPAWCAGHEGQPAGCRSDFLHRSPARAFAFRGKQLGAAGLVQGPFAEHASRLTEAHLTLIIEGVTLNPVGLYDLAGALDRYTDRLRDLADELHALLGGGR